MRHRDCRSGNSFKYRNPGPRGHVGDNRLSIGKSPWGVGMMVTAHLRGEIKAGSSGCGFFTQDKGGE